MGMQIRAPRAQKALTIVAVIASVVVAVILTVTVGQPFIEDQKQAWRYKMYVLAERLQVY